jgi:hypothetical protein
MLPSTIVALGERLGPQLPDDFSRAVLSGSLRALSDDNNRIRVSLFALGIRELVRHVLEQMAPDDEVKRCKWFTHAHDNADKPSTRSGERVKVTRRDRMIYAIQGGIPDTLFKKTGFDNKRAQDRLLSTIDGLNKHVHMQPEYLMTPAASIVGLVEEVFEVVFDFLEAVEEFRVQVREAVSSSVNEEVFKAFFLTVDNLDVLSTHTRVEAVQADDVLAVKLGASEVLFEVSGTVYVELIYGSGSDERSGNGARINDQYPFTMTFFCVYGRP